MNAVLKRFADSAVFRSIFRHGFADTNRNRKLVMVTNLFLHIHPVRVRRRAIAFGRTFYLGGLSAACFFVLVVTGVLLMFYYRPSVPDAYHDMKDLEFAVDSGMFLRNLHRWAAHAMVALVLAHMAVTFFRAAYRSPRELNWVIGVLLLLATVLLSYTGYLLPWDQLAFWAVTVGTNLADAAPIVGAKLKLLLLGGHSINGAALLRFYVLHCVLLPAGLTLGLSVHIWRLRKDGGIYLPPVTREEAGPS
jgi:quinol-cytochrome oxidoreductase complex cytochrome b subunit